MRKLASALLLAVALPALAALSSTANRQDYTAGGATTAFAFTFKTYAASHVEVFLNGAKQVSGFTTTLNANQDTSPGGTVTFTTAPAAGTTVRLQRTLPLTQETSLNAYAPFPAKTVEKRLDQLVQQAQQAKRDLDDNIASFTAQAAAANSDTPVTATGATTPRKLKDRFADTVNVKDFGAVGDGATDDAAAIQAALNAATGEVVFPPGTYKCNAGLTLRTGVSLRGAGKETVIGGRGTRLDFTGAPDAAVPLRIADLSDVRVVGFDIRGKATGSAPVIYATGMNRRIRLQDLAIVSSAPVTLVNLNPTGEGAMIQSVVEGVVAVGGTTGFAVGGASTSIAFNHCYANANTGAGFHIYGTYIAITACAADSNQIGYLLRGAKNVSIVGSGAESNTRAGVVISLASGVSIVSFRSYQNSAGDAGFYPSFLDLQDNADLVTVLGATDDGASLASRSIASSDSLANAARVVLVNSSLSRTINPNMSAVTIMAGSVSLPKAFASKRVLLTYGAAVSVDAGLGNEFVLSPTDGNAFTVGNPSNGTEGQRITVRVRNGIGGVLGAVTWGADYKMAAWTSPANGFSQSIDFQFNGVAWVEVSRTSADVPN